MSVLDDEIMLSNDSEQEKRNQNSYGSIQEYHEPPEQTALYTPLDVEFSVYKRRFYIILLFSMVGFCQNMVWITFSPISKPAERVFNMDDADISLLANWGPIAYIISVIPAAYCMDVLGLRTALLTVSLCMAVGTGLRCITFDRNMAIWLIHAGHFLNGVAGPVLMSGPPLLSSLWFPPNERTTATAVGSQLMNWGLASTFIGSPYIVPDTMKNHTNGSMFADVDLERTRIKYLFYGEFAMCCAVMVLVLIYFPSKPPLPPSKSASVQRLDFWPGLKQLCRQREFWLIALSYGVATGVYNAWSAVLNVNMSPLGISEKEAGWLGFSMLVVGPLSGMLIGRYVDWIGRRLKEVSIFLLIVSAAFFAAFASLCLSAVSDKIGSHEVVTTLLFATAILGSACVMGSWALFYELSVEETYPAPEGITTGVVTCLNNVAALLFLGVLPLMPSIGTSWMNWLLVSSMVVCVPLLLVLKETYRRSLFDSEHGE